MYERAVDDELDVAKNAPNLTKLNAFGDMFEPQLNVVERREPL